VSATNRAGSLVGMGAARTFTRLAVVRVRCRPFRPARRHPSDRALPRGVLAEVRPRRGRLFPGSGRGPPGMPMGG
jgi:hypothetical protein